MAARIEQIREQRTLPGRLEIRAADAGDAAPTIAGYAALFNSESNVINGWYGQFKEVIAPGAFSKTLKDGADVRALLNHDPNWVLGRTKSGTLALREDERGLWMEITPPETSWARDLLTTIRRGDVDQCSFGFQTIQDDWDRSTDEAGRDIDLHILREARLFDVSVVTYPAYAETSAVVRSLCYGSGIDEDSLTRVILQARRGQPIDAAGVAALQAAIEQLRSYLPDLVSRPEPEAAHLDTQPAVTTEPDPSAVHYVSEERMREVKRQLERVELLVRGRNSFGRARENDRAAQGVERARPGPAPAG